MNALCFSIHKLVPLAMFFPIASAFFAVGWENMAAATTPRVWQSPSDGARSMWSVSFALPRKGRSSHRQDLILCSQCLNASSNSDDGSSSVSYNEYVSRDRRELRKGKSYSPELLKVLQTALSLITFGIGVGVGISIVFILALLKWILPSLLSASAGEQLASTADQTSERDSTAAPTAASSSSNISTKDGSRTAILALYSRMQLHYMFNGSDDLAPRLLKSIGETSNDANSVKTIRLLQFCGWLSRINYILTRTVFEDQVAYLATLGHTGLVTPLHCRTCWFDDCVQSFIQSQSGSNSNTSANLVILGAGFDTRCYRFQQRLAENRIRCYEIDAGGTQKVKQRVLQHAKVDTSAIAYCACDFESENWLDVLLKNDFEPKFPTLILWEGVTMYLPQSTIVETLQTISSTANNYQTKWYVGFDYINGSWAMSRPWKYIMSRAQEPFQFAANTEQEVNDLVASCDLDVLEHVSQPEDLEYRYIPEASGGIVGDYGGFVVAGIP